MMEDLVNELASLQAELRAEEDETNGDEIVIKLRLAITDLEKQLEVANAELSNELRYYTTTCNTIKTEIEDISAQIIDAWDGEKRTVRYGAGLLKFRTTTSLKIHDGQILLDNLIHHFPTYVIVEEYISGFNKTQVRKFIDLHPQSHGVIELVPKTSVKLEVKSD